MVDSDGPETKTSGPATGEGPLEALVRDARARAVPSAIPDERERERAIGSTIGRFTIVDRLGRGGMGAVYRAYDPTLDRAVAIKMLHEGHDPQRLMREAQALARLQHPNVLTVHEAGVDDGQPYLATELVDGDNLADWLRAEPREREDILEVFGRRSPACGRSRVRWPSGSRPSPAAPPTSPRPPRSLRRSGAP